MNNILLLYKMVGLAFANFFVDVSFADLCGKREVNYIWAHAAYLTSGCSDLHHLFLWVLKLLSFK